MPEDKDKKPPDSGPKEYHNVLKRVALLGADIPEVKTLEDVNALGEPGRLEGVEIFEAGAYRGETYSTDFIDQVVDNFLRLKERIKPPLGMTPASLGDLALGHDKHQEFLKKAGLPAGGIVDRLYRKGAKLVADFSHVPEAVRSAIRNKAYFRVSSEFYPVYAFDEDANTVWMIKTADQKTKGGEEVRTYTEDEYKTAITKATDEAKAEATKTTASEFQEKIDEAKAETEKAAKEVTNLRLKARDERIEAFVETYSTKAVAPAILEDAKVVLAGLDGETAIKFGEEKDEATPFERTLKAFQEILDKTVEGKALIPEGERAKGDGDEKTFDEEGLTDEERKESEEMAKAANARRGIKSTE